MLGPPVIPSARCGAGFQPADLPLAGPADLKGRQQSPAALQNRDRQGADGVGQGRACGARTLACRVDTRVDTLFAFRPWIKFFVAASEARPSGSAFRLNEPCPFGSGQESTSALAGEGAVTNPYGPREART
jgi:hypothetical protein